MSDTIGTLAREPALGLLRVSEHIEKRTAVVVESRHLLTDSSVGVPGSQEDLAYSFRTVHSMYSVGTPPLSPLLFFLLVFLLGLHRVSVARKPYQEGGGAEADDQCKGGGGGKGVSRGWRTSISYAER